MTKCYLETVTGIMRAGPETDDFGKPYEFSCTVLIDGERAYLKGACGKYGRDTFRAIVEELKRHGVKTLIWERKNNKTRTIQKNISDKDDVA